MKNPLQIAFFGSSLISAFWNGAATYYRGIIKTLHQQGHSITFYEPNIYGRQENRDIPDPDYAKVIIYQPTEDDLSKCLELAKTSEIIIKASGVGVFDRELEEGVLNLKKEGKQIIFWDVDAPATLEGMIKERNHYFKTLVPKFDQILTYGGGQPVEKVYKTFGAKECTSIYNAFDPDTHHPVPAQEAYTCDLAFLGNRLPDRESRVEKYFLEVAEELPDKKFILGGSGWADKPLPKNVKYIGHVPTSDHNAFNCSPLAVLNISRDSMATYGFSPATRVFEAAGAGACIITDAWNGISEFFEPKQEIFVANSPEEVKNHLLFLGEKCAKSIGMEALNKARNSHTYGHRAQQLEEILQLKNNVI